ncbi:hypothetical protein [Pseudomonas nunensis]|uniref:hypothetical protein n=1 Tax=Pseudomonas nunensis TaxID=2961896 RepID=UPI0025B10957|nr:hypothetical protein [Pseudomonas nunensis]MDN3224587.1 hypothetical protein [Pseudomonas nunensis]
MMGSVNFNADLWYWKALEDFIAYKDIHEFVSSKSAMKAHTNSMSYSSLVSDSHTSETEIKLAEFSEDSLKGSLDHFAALTIVGMCASFEVAAKDFFRNLFMVHPEYMHEYIGAEKQKGQIPLLDIVNMGDYKKLIEDLSLKSASIASKGKYGMVLARAHKLCGLEKDEKIVGQINKIQGDRNKIVHEKKVVGRKVSDVAEVHAVIAECLEALIKCAIQKKIDGRYTCFTGENVFVADNLIVASDS